MSAAAVVPLPRPGGPFPALAQFLGNANWRIASVLNGLFFSSHGWDSNCSRQWDSGRSRMGHPGSRQKAGGDLVGIDAAGSTGPGDGPAFYELGEVAGHRAARDIADLRQFPNRGKAFARVIGKADQALQGPAQTGF